MAKVSVKPRSAAVKQHSVVAKPRLAVVGSIQIAPEVAANKEVDVPAASSQIYSAAVIVRILIWRRDWATNACR